MYCWGENGRGQLGSGDTQNRVRKARHDNITWSKAQRDTVGPASENSKLASTFDDDDDDDDGRHRERQTVDRDRDQPSCAERLRNSTWSSLVNLGVRL